VEIFDLSPEEKLIEYVSAYIKRLKDIKVDLPDKLKAAGT
jgi:hypothetical protein